MKRSPLIILFITVAIDLLGFGIILPLLPLYVTKYGGDEVTGGWLSASYSITQFLFAPLWGRMSDLHGRRPLILLSLLGSAITFLIFGAAPNLAVLFLARIVAGIATAASLPTAQAYIADVTTPEKRSRGMAMIGVAFGVGFACGPWIGGALGKINLSLPAFVVAGMAACNLIWSFFALPESHTTGRDELHARKAKLLDTTAFTAAFSSAALAELLTVFCVSTFAFALMESTFTWLVLFRIVDPHHGVATVTPELRKQAAAVVGPMFGIVGITAVFSQGAVMGGLAERLGERKLIWIGALVLAGSLCGIAVANSIALLTILGALLAFGSGMMNPSLTSLISKEAGRGERGGVLGVQQGLSSFARIIAPPLGTWLLTIRLGALYGSASYVLSAGLMFLAFFLSLKLREPPSMEGEAPEVALH